MVMKDSSIKKEDMRLCNGHGPVSRRLPGAFMKKVLYGLVFLSLIVFFGGCVRSSTMKKALAEAESAKAQASEVEKANREHLEEIASLKEEIKELRRHNEALVAKDLGRSELIASLEKTLKKTKTENETLWKEIEKLRIAMRRAKPKAGITAGVTSRYLELYRTLKEDIDMGTVSIMRGEGTLTIFIKDKSLFEPGMSALLPEGKALLQRIISAQGPLEAKEKSIEVRPVLSCELENGGAKKGNLAERRAAVVTRFLNERTDIGRGAGRGLPYEEAPGLSLPGYLGLVFPVGK